MRGWSFLTLLLVLALAACSDGSDTDDEQAATSSVPVATRAAQTGAAVSSDPPAPDSLLRDFVLPLPLFAPDSAWNQKVTDVPALPDSEQRILTMYRVLLGDDSTIEPKGLFPDPYPFVWLNFEDYSTPVAEGGGPELSVLICTYDGDLTWVSPKFGSAADEAGGPVTVPAPVAVARPAGPAGTDSDGHLVLYDPNTHTEYDFWQATTSRSGECSSDGAAIPGTAILEAGNIDFFDVRGAGANPVGYFSARSSGVPLLAGLIVPEDIERGAIDHALTFAMPGVRSVRGAAEDPDPRDIIYPASQIEPDYYNTNAYAFAHGQRIRLKATIVDADGEPVDESTLAPITRMFLEALRTYGAYLVDNAGGFVFSAEDFHSANLRLPDDQVSALAGLPPGTPLPEDKTKWQVVMEKLLAELSELPGHENGLPIASSGSQPWWAYESDEHDPATATFGVSNFEVIESAATSAGRAGASRSDP